MRHLQNTNGIVLYGPPDKMEYLSLIMNEMNQTFMFIYILQISFIIWCK